MSTGTEFTTLWPVTLLRRILPGFEPANRELERIIVEMESSQRDLTTDYRNQNFFAIRNPAVQWLHQCAHSAAREYCQHTGPDYPVEWTIQAWPNINRLGDYHDPHNHPRAYLSGTYYVRTPAVGALPHSRADVRPGCITFYDPRTGVNMNAIAGDPYVEPEHTVSPEPGLILLWPAFLMHFVHPNLSDELRISVSFNVVIKRPGDYLPRQI